MNSQVVALVGSPNSGKTTLFNWLTNRKYKTVNYPGATVDYAVAHIAPQWGSDIEIIDTPGIYSLSPKSEDEEVTYRVLFHSASWGSIQTVVVVVDGTQMARHLTLVSQLLACGFKVVVALTMSDLIRKAGQEIDVQLLSRELACPVVLIDGLLGGGVQDLVKTIDTSIKSFAQIESQSESVPAIKPFFEDQQSHFEFLQKMEALSARVLIDKTLAKDKNQTLLQRTRQVDRWALHPILGLGFFILIMSFLFTAIFFVASPFMDAIDSLFSVLAAAVVSAGTEGSLLSDFVGNGIVSSFGAVLVFVPQIFILFLLLGFLESTGYLARAATLIDKPFSHFGLSGRSFVPIMSGFACAVPAIMATRNISSKRDRFITMMVIPLMTCSARLPVYSLLLAFLLRGRPAWQAGVSLALLYVGGLFVGALVAQFLHRFVKKGKNSFFMMELPLYRRPRLSVVLDSAWTKTLGYVKRAGPPIFIFALLVWVGTTFPNYKADNEQVKLETSYAGQLGRTIEPVFTPMGVDWRVGVSLISAFAAREVFASSLAVIFNVTAEDDTSLQAGLLDSMREAKDARGAPIFTTGSVIGLLIFVMVALQCTSTTAMVIRETGKVSWALIQLIAFNLLAYIMAVGAFRLWS